MGLCVFVRRYPHRGGLLPERVPTHRRLPTRHLEHNPILVSKVRSLQVPAAALWVGASVPAGADTDAHGDAPPYARPGVALAVVALAYAISVLLAWPGLRQPDGALPGWVAVLLEATITLAPLLVGALLAARLGGPRVAAALGLRGRWIDLLLGAAVTLIARAVIELVVPTTGSLRPLLDGDALSVAALVTTVVVLVLLAPIVEELFFRGALQRALQTLLGGAVGARVAAVVAIAVTTLAFVLLHAVPYGADVPLGILLPPLLIGVGAGVLTSVTGRITAGLVAHVLLNLSGVVLLLVS